MNNLAPVDLNLGNTPKRMAYLRGYGRIQTILDTNTSPVTFVDGKPVLNKEPITTTYYTHGRLQPLCGKFGEHFPQNAVMEKTQTTLAWDATVPRVKCGYQNQNLEKITGINSQLPLDLQVQQAGESVRSPTASYYSTDGMFHDGNKC